MTGAARTAVAEARARAEKLGRALITTGNVGLHDSIAATELALVDRRAGVYQRVDGTICRVLSTDAGPSIEGLSADTLRPIVASVAVFPTLGAPDAWKPASRDLIAALAKKRDWEHLPVLRGLVTAPTFLVDGRVLAREGYDAPSGVCLAPTSAYPPVPDSPTRADAGRAADELWGLFAEFEWADPAIDRPVVLAAILTIAARYACGDSVPAFLFGSTTRGSGKSLAARVAALVAAGHVPASRPLSPEQEEQRKMLFTVALEGHSVVLFDNAVGQVGGAALSLALTAGSVTDRVLGHSRTGSASFRAVVLLTGNNLRLAGDFDRRVLIANQAPEVERPEDRQPPNGFRFPNLLEHARREHPRLLVAALAILRAYHVAGRPGHGRPPMGSFEAWDAIVRGALIWCGVGDPCSSRARAEAADDDAATLGALLAAWHGAFGEEPRTLAKAWTECCGGGTEAADALREALAALDPAGGASGKLNTRSVGRQLGSYAGRILGGLRLEKRGARSQSQWRVVEVGGYSGGSLGVTGVSNLPTHTEGTQCMGGGGTDSPLAQTPTVGAASAPTATIAPTDAGGPDSPDVPCRRCGTLVTRNRHGCLSCPNCEPDRGAVLCDACRSPLRRDSRGRKFCPSCNPQPAALAVPLPGAQK